MGRRAEICQASLSNFLIPFEGGGGGRSLFHTAARNKEGGRRRRVKESIHCPLLRMSKRNPEKKKEGRVDFRYLFSADVRAGEKKGQEEKE